MGTETEQGRSARRHRRTLFDSAAELYQASRRGYPSHLVDHVVTTAGLDAGSAVLEVGCGTGQLTECLARYGFDLTAIDIGPSMIATASQRLQHSGASFLVASFESFTAAEASFDLIIAGTAFHWVDPEIKFRKPARLLRPGGWLAVLSTRERYDDPFGTSLREMWIARSGVWLPQASVESEIIADAAPFEPPLHVMDERRLTLPVETVISVENTRATSLSWPAEVRREFTEEMRRQLSSQTEVHLTQETSLTMARVPQS